MSLKSTHKFTFKANEISLAAIKRANYHDERLRFWKEEQQKAIALAKEAGVEIREHEISGGIDVEVIIDRSISNRLTECSNKIQEHQSLASRLKIEAAAYSTQGERPYELDPDDIVYFRLVE